MPDFAQPEWLALIAVLALLVGASLRRMRRASTRSITAAGLRLLSFAALVVALAGPLAGAYSRHTDVVFALDVSRSMARESIAEALAFFNRALAGKPPEARMGLVVFGADAAVESLVRSAGEPVAEIQAQVDPIGTDLGRAIEVAVGAFPPGEQRRIVLVTDGNENLGDARAAAAVARSLGVGIDAVALETLAPQQEVSVRALSVPARVHAHEPFKLQALVQSSAAGAAQLSIMRNGSRVHDIAVDLKPGANAYSFVEQVDAAGLQEYEAILSSNADAEPENNRYQAFVEVEGAPRVLLAIGAPEAGRYVSAALRAQGLAVDEVAASALPATLHELLHYDLVVMDNVSGFDLSLDRMELLERYVRDAGGGVVTIGGDRSYAAGGYAGTPLERLLPVAMKVATEAHTPTVAVVFVLDRSGSMSAASHGEEKIAIAKNAALASIDLLKRVDRVAVLAFDSEREWIVPPTEAGMREEIVRKLRDLQPGGGTDIYGALEEAYRVMRQERATVKHLIVLSDGLAEGEADFDALSARIAADGITISTVAMGGDADLQLMARIAALGKGRYYHSEDPANVPRIFTSETLALARDRIVEGHIRPQPSDGGELLAGLGASEFPILGGYQRTAAKPAAQVLLAGPDDDPILVSWRYGLGKAVAFTSDLTGRWGRRWVEWGDFGRFVSQMARWAMRRGGRESFAVRFGWHGRAGTLDVDVRDADERFLNGLELTAVLLNPSGESSSLRLEQDAPGRYHGAFPVSGSGHYYFTLSGRDGAQSVGPRTFGLAIPYSSEYLDLGVKRTLLAEITAATGGRVLPLSAESLTAITRAAANAPGPRWRVWWPFFLAALILLVAEVAVRKLPLPDAWRARWEAWRGARNNDAAVSAQQGRLQSIPVQHRARQTVANASTADDPTARARFYMAAGRRR
ncbi:MAG TPA: VWA domain-containing protein [Burkholderiales bacterium]|nr:VWA domain-containing protein [Burkholderiales bacterium]